MRELFEGGRRAAMLWWLPVVVAVAALFAVPLRTNAADLASLQVTPSAGQYGGTNAHWVVNGLPAGQRAHLQRRGSTTSAWADVPDSFGIGTTDGSGHLEFSFPTPAMNSVYFRVVTNGGASAEVRFTSKHQDADLRVVETNPAEVPLPETIAEGLAVKNEGFKLRVDTIHGAGGETKPILSGRAVTLQRRTSGGDWSPVTTGTVGGDGLLSFDGAGDLAQTPGYYRVRLENWTQGGDRIGWFLSFPFRLRVVTRPDPVLLAVATAPTSSRVDLTWALPSVSPAKIVIARDVGRDADLRDVIATLSPVTSSSISYSDRSVSGSTDYHYALYSVSAAGVYSRVPARAQVTTPSGGGNH